MLLVLLIATASFAFVLRAVEFVVVRNQIAEITGFFESIGILSHRDGTTADIYPAIELIANSPHVAFYDKRRGFEGTLVDMPNAYVIGSRYWRASWLMRYFAGHFDIREYEDLMPRLEPMPGFAGFANGDSFFYGELVDVEFVAAPRWGRFEVGFYPHKLLHVVVDEVMQGYPERIGVNQNLMLRMDFPDGNTGRSPLADMEIGQRYFFKSTFYWRLGGLSFTLTNPLQYIKPIGEAGLWYVPVAMGENVDTVALGLCQELEFAYHAQSAVYLRTTRDMTYLPFAQQGQGILSLLDGRLLNMDDYVNARPVIVVPRRFADVRGVGVGDTLRVNVNAQQHLMHSPYYLIGNLDDMDPWPDPIFIFPELGVLSKPGGYPYITLELEVVGIYDMFRFRPIYTNWSSLSKFMFIPDSLLPSDWALQSAHFGDITAEYSPSLWFSFVLNDPRNQDAFLIETRDPLAEMGLRASFVGRDGSGFLATADTILLSITLNLIIFTAVLVMVLAFTVALLCGSVVRTMQSCEPLAVVLKTSTHNLLWPLCFLGYQQ